MTLVTLTKIPLSAWTSLGEGIEESDYFEAWNIDDSDAIEEEEY